MNLERSRYFPLPLQISARAWHDLELTLELARPAAASPLYPLRLLAERRQQRRPQRPASPGELNLLALLSRVFRHVTDRYLEARGCAVAADGVDLAGRRVPLSALGEVLTAFVRLYPPAAVLAGAPAAAYLAGEEEGSRRRLALIELFLLTVQTGNPAAAPFLDLFDDADLARSVPYRQLLAELDAALARESAAGLLAGSLLALLRAPLQASPHALDGQIEYIRQRWGQLLPPELLQEIGTALAVLAEERQRRGGGPGPIAVPRFGRGTAGWEEPERFSPDTDWMPNLVLIAKTIYVWLDQLARTCGRPITRLDQIPDEELDRLARWGFTGLWLIGIWERSPASEKIKRIMGNPEAAPSAYSLYDYAVAADLGGEAALQTLRERCRQRGIRLGCDVVPNHTGIYSRWTREHPDWFIQLDYPPYPGYRFSGPDLSFSDDVSIQIEDGYWNHSEAAVVFRHLDRRSGRTRYIYHGNDGTHLPWNDTAQLNFLLPEVREAMIATIVQVARSFPIIRFDAAMTLAKKHFQRLWFPPPGGGSGVPSRAEHALDPEAFEAAFPEEFWRQVVDRVAAEVPDTLLLAEAFWLMEGFFVRTLGMHRVYNSAFMNMLKAEDNAKYRSVLKNILDFNPQILQRFVNFMNNPDEATAVAQFGKGDKYFGVAVLLATMPGLPMFGHGQVEGLEEKYGMEYRRAYRDEAPDEGFIRHHEAQLFPLLRRRHLFSGAAHFDLYDFWSGGVVNEDVFAYSNRSGDERALVVVHNRCADTGGWLRESVPRRVRDAGGERLARTTLAEALGVRGDEGWFCRFRDHRSGLEYLRRGGALAAEGLHLALGPYQYHVFHDFRQVEDPDGSWGRLCERLDGRPVPNLEREWKRLCYAPLHEAGRRLFAPALLRGLGRLPALPPARWRQEPVFRDFSREAAAFFAALGETAAGDLAGRVVEDLAAVRRLSALKSRLRQEREALAAFRRGMPGPATPPAGPRQAQFLRVFLPWLLLRRTAGSAAGAAARMEELLLTETLQHALQAAPPPFDLPEGEAAGEALLVEILVRHQQFAAPEADLRRGWRELLGEARVQAFLGCNWYAGVQWFNQERLETLLFWLFAAAAVAVATGPAGADRTRLLARLAELHRYLESCRGLAAKVGFRVDRFLEVV